MSFKRKILLSTIITFILCITFFFNVSNAIKYIDVEDKNVYQVFEDVQIENISFYKELKDGREIAGVQGYIKNELDKDCEIYVVINYYDDDFKKISTKTDYVEIKGKSRCHYKGRITNDELKRGYTVNDIDRYDIEVINLNPSTLTPELLNRNYYYEQLEKALPSKGYKYFIKNHDIKVDVDTNNKCRVNETVEVKYLVDTNEFVKFIPTRFEMTHNNGEAFLKDATLKNLKANEKIETKRETDGTWVTINKDVRKGTQVTYKFLYEYDFKQDKAKGKDVFNFNIANDKAPDVIGKLHFTINMPTEIDRDHLVILHKTPNITERPDIKLFVEGDTLVGRSDKAVMPYQKIAVNIDLPDKFFYYENEETLLENNKFYYFLFPAFMVLSIIIWFKYGKNKKVKVEVQYNPPSGLNSAEVEYIYKGYSTDSGVISLIYELANKGYIKIEEKNTGSLLTSKGFVITKLKEYDGSNKLEEVMFKGLFEEDLLDYSDVNGDYPNYQEFKKIGLRDRVTDVQLSKNFYKTTQEVKTLLQTPENHYKTHVKAPKFVKTVMQAMLLITLLVINIQIFKLLGITALITGLFLGFGLFMGVCMLFTHGEPGVVYVNGVPSYADKTQTTFLKIIWCIMAIFVPLFMILFALYMEYMEFLPIYFLSLATYVVMCLCVNDMKKRNPLGDELYAQVCGFRLFLENSNSKELEKILKENPQYYYDILPYMYSLNISEAGLSKFLNIMVGDISEFCSPNIYVSPNDVNTFNSNVMSTAKVPKYIPKEVKNKTNNYNSNNNNNNDNNDIHDDNSNTNIDNK